MAKNRLSLAALTASFLAVAWPLASFAHEAYVLPRDYFWNVINSPINWNALDAFAKPGNQRTAAYVIGGTLVGLALNFLFRRSRAGQAAHAAVERLAFLGPIFVRVAIAGALFFGALSWNFLGPELSFADWPFAPLIRWTLIAISICLVAGIFTEIAAAAGLALFFSFFSLYGPYPFTYLNYFGELVVLILFGMRQWSFDRRIFGPLRRLKRWEKYAPVIVRVCYGLALIYAGVTIKFLHPDLTMTVVRDWHLTQFHWLFPSDPLLVTAGAGLAETAIGLFIIFGFEMRLTTLVSLFYITLSLLYFRELVWPHLLLYGISLNLFVQPETFTLDRLFFGRRNDEKHV